MNCEQTQDQLSEYLDRSLPADVAAALEKHLEACPACAQEAVLLRRTILEISKLPTVDPPLGFSQRVMACVRETELQPTLWQRLLVPLRAKIPLQATAVLIVAFLGMYLFQKNEKDALENSSRIQQSLLAEDASSSIKRNTETQETLAETVPSTPGGVTESPARMASNTASTETRETSLGTSRREPVFSGTPVAIPAPGPASGSLAPFRGRFPFENPFRTTPGSMELFADYELVVRRHADVAEKREASASDSTAGGIAVDSAPTSRAERLMAALPDSSRLQTIWISVPVNQYEQFKQELRVLGTIVSEVRVPLFTNQAPFRSDGQFHVKLTALPADEGATPEP